MENMIKNVNIQVLNMTGKVIFLKALKHLMIVGDMEVPEKKISSQLNPNLLDIVLYCHCKCYFLTLTLLKI